jgi:hypothetical protein
LAERGKFSAIWGEKKLFAAFTAEKYPFQVLFQTILYAYGAVPALKNIGKNIKRNDLGVVQQANSILKPNTLRAQVKTRGCHFCACCTIS